MTMNSTPFFSHGGRSMAQDQPGRDTRGQEMSEPTGKLATMTTTPKPDAVDAVVRTAEELLSQAATTIIGPAVDECLLCYIHRMLLAFGCDTSLRFALHYRDVRAPRATALSRRLGTGGGYCDCEVFLNAYDLRPEHWTPEVEHQRDGYVEIEEAMWPDPLPAVSACGQARRSRVDSGGVAGVAGVEGREASHRTHPRTHPHGRRPARKLAVGADATAAAHRRGSPRTHRPGR